MGGLREVFRPKNMAQLWYWCWYWDHELSPSLQRQTWLLGCLKLGPAQPSSLNIQLVAKIGQLEVSSALGWMGLAQRWPWSWEGQR